MKWVADECVDYSIIEALRDSGHEVWYVAEQRKGIDDDEVLDLARKKQAILLTGDKDFGALVFRQKRTNSGVLLLRLAGLPAQKKARLVIDAVRLHEPEFEGAFSVLTPTTLRIRR